MPTILKTSGLSTEQFSLIASVFPIGGAIGAAIIGRYMDKINPHRVIKSAYLIAFILFITASFIHSNLFLLSLTILLTGAMLVVLRQLYYLWQRFHIQLSVEQLVYRGCMESDD